MFPLTLNLSLPRLLPPSSVSLSSAFLSPFPLFVKPKPTSIHGFNQRIKKEVLRRGRGGGVCRAELSQDAPLAVAIGACMLYSFLFPYAGGGDDDESGRTVGPTDSRFAIMSVISFIPLFNWLSWVFAWTDTGNPRYAVYAAVYLAPYLRTNLSLSPEESWLPIASIVLCIVHIQIEASSRDGDLQGFTFFSEAAKRLGLIARRKDRHSTSKGKRREDETHNNMELPPGKQESRDEVRGWGVPRKPSQDLEQVNEDGDRDDEAKYWG